MFIDFREEGRERKKEKNWCERETSVSFLPSVRQPETKPAAWECALNQELKQQLLGVRDDTPTIWATWPGQHS